MLQAEEDMLVIAAQSGNRAALMRLVQAYQTPLKRFAYQLSRDQEVAKDSVQEVWLDVTQRLHRLKDPRAFRSWLYRMLRWRVLDIQRKNQRLKSRFSALEDNQEASAPVTTSEHDALNYAIKRLPDIERQMIHLFYLDDMSLQEIAGVLEIPVGTVKSRLNRARTQLKSKLNLSE